MATIDPHGERVLNDAAMLAIDRSNELRAEGVTYRELPEIPGAMFFDCSRLHAGLRTKPYVLGLHPTPLNVVPSKTLRMTTPVAPAVD